MRIALSIIFYTLIFACIGTIAIAFALHIMSIDDVLMLMTYAYNEQNIRIIVGLCGGIFIMLSFAAANIITGKIQREKTIAFANPNGQVTVTLSAVEDLIKRLSHQLSEIKEAKADVRAVKKGIDVRMRVVLRSETNIPDFTAKLQDLIANRIQEVFGIDEPITVRIHVAKIITSEDKTKKKQEKIIEEINAPYPGIKI